MQWRAKRICQYMWLLPIFQIWQEEQISLQIWPLYYYKVMFIHKIGYGAPLIYAIDGTMKYWKPYYLHYMLPLGLHWSYAMRGQESRDKVYQCAGFMWHISSREICSGFLKKKEFKGWGLWSLLSQRHLPSQMKPIRHFLWVHFRW